MKTVNFISSRLAFKGRISVAAIAVSFFVIIISVAISSGFRHGISDAVASAAGDVSVNVEGEDIQERISEILCVAGVKSVTPAIYAGGMVKSGDEISGVMVKGVPREGASPLSVSVPDKLASQLGIKVSDPLLTYFADEKVKVRKFTVDEIHPSHFSFGESGAVTLIASIEDIRKVADVGEGGASVLEVTLDDRFRSEGAMRSKAGEISCLTGLYATAAVDRFGNLYSWLEIIEANVLAILVLMSIVAGFNMISGLLIMLFRETSTIGTLKTLGMGDTQISKVFLQVAARTTLKGMAAGNAAALLFCLVQGLTHVVKLNPDNYFLSYVPIHVNLPLVLAADAAAFAVIMLLNLLPVLFVAKVDPAVTVRVK